MPHWYLSSSMASRKKHCWFKQQLPHWVQVPEIWLDSFRRTAKNDSKYLCTGPWERALWWIFNFWIVSRELRMYFGFKKIKPKSKGKAGKATLASNNNDLAGNWMNVFFKTKLFEWRLDGKLVKILCLSCFKAMTRCYFFPIRQSTQWSALEIQNANLAWCNFVRAWNSFELSNGLRDGERRIPSPMSWNWLLES